MGVLQDPSLSRNFGNVFHGLETHNTAGGCLDHAALRNSLPSLRERWNYRGSFVWGPCRVLSLANPQPHKEACRSQAKQAKQAKQAQPSKRCSQCTEIETLHAPPCTVPWMGPTTVPSPIIHAPNTHIQTWPHSTAVANHIFFFQSYKTVPISYLNWFLKKGICTAKCHCNPCRQSLNLLTTNENEK